MPNNLTGYYNPRLGIGSPPPTSMPAYNQYGQMDEAAMRGQVNAPSQPYTPATAADIRARSDAARAGEGTVDIYRGDGTSTHVTGSQLRASEDPDLVQYRQQAQASGVSDPNMLFGAEGGGRQQSEEERAYRHAYHNFMRNPNKGVDHNEAIRALGMWAAAVGAAYALPAAGAGAGAGTGSGLTTMTAAEQAAIASGLTNVPAGLGAAGGVGAGAAGASAAGAGVGFGGAGTGGMAGNLVADLGAVQMGGGAAGSLAASGGIAGGAGAMSGVPSWLTTAGNYADNLNGMTGGGEGSGGSGGSGGQPMPQGGFMGSQARMPQPQAARGSQLPILQGTQPQLQAVGRRPYNFRGTTIWM